ncbi:MAG: hypothetical protein ACI35R_16820 [Bacillus sp. (in: firmicutes)]
MKALHLFKRRKKELKPYEYKEESKAVQKPPVEKESINPVLFKEAENAVKYIYQTTLMVADVDPKYYEQYKSRYLKKNQIFPANEDGDLMREMKLLDIFFNTFLYSKQGIESGYDFDEEELRENVENIINQCMELERRFGINYMSRIAE